MVEQWHQSQDVGTPFTGMCESRSLLSSRKDLFLQICFLQHKILTQAHTQVCMGYRAEPGQPGPGETRMPAGSSLLISSTLFSSLENTTGSHPRDPKYCTKA